MVRAAQVGACQMAHIDLAVQRDAAGVVSGPIEREAILEVVHEGAALAGGAAAAATVVQLDVESGALEDTALDVDVVAYELDVAHGSGSCECVLGCFDPVNVVLRSRRAEFRSAYTRISLCAAPLFGFSLQCFPQGGPQTFVQEAAADPCTSAGGLLVMICSSENRITQAASQFSFAFFMIAANVASSSASPFGNPASFVGEFEARQRYEVLQAESWQSAGDGAEDDTLSVLIPPRQSARTEAVDMMAARREAGMPVSGCAPSAGRHPGRIRRRPRWRSVR